MVPHRVFLASLRWLSAFDRQCVCPDYSQSVNA
jgi:hypothetical protein